MEKEQQQNDKYIFVSVIKQKNDEKMTLLCITPCIHDADILSYKNKNSNQLNYSDTYHPVLVVGYIAFVILLLDAL